MDTWRKNFELINSPEYKAYKEKYGYYSHCPKCLGICINKQFWTCVCKERCRECGLGANPMFPCVCIPKKSWWRRLFKI